MTRLIEFIIFLFSVVGTILVSSLDDSKQLTGFYFWIIGNVFAIGFFAHNKMYLMCLQFLIYLVIAIQAIAVRM